ncbi:MAG: phosphoribosylformylglycinamidine cyclo-ligase [Deltaproteobacteria bacterium RBG_13_43_22]|nr:MAG: phosphoribosylformylglycinamidine cyclo-ligase [Deltaproteobacteria bacterium RBG_13_43_22]
MDLYQKAGVDIHLGNTFIDRIKPLIRQTFSPEVITDIGGFSGLFRLDPSAYSEPVLVSSTDGVGTKLKVAQQLGQHQSVGIDLVAMSVNDIIVQGARPLFFLDYLATGRLDLETQTAIIEGIVKGCQQAGCALIGGETAEMPGMYPSGEYDLAGFVVGIVEKEKIINGSKIAPGDRVIGLASSGLHSNGYSLVRKIFFEDLRINPREVFSELGLPLGEELLKPTRIYVRSILSLIKDYTIKGMAHITGGGITDNLPRILPADCRARITKDSWEIPPIFSLIKRLGQVSEKEMHQVFNNGLGMILVVPHDQTHDIISRLEGSGEPCFLIGEIVPRSQPEIPIEWV